MVAGHEFEARVRAQTPKKERRSHNKEMAP